MPPAAPAPAKPDTKQLPFTKATKPALGLFVLACNTPKSGVDEPTPAIVTRVYGTPNRVDLETFHPRSSNFMHTHPVEHATICFDEAELIEALGRGDKWVCYPYDPMDPKAYVPKKAPGNPRPEPSK